MLFRGFKALKQIVKLHYQLGNTEEMLAAYKCACGCAVVRAISQYSLCAKVFVYH